MKLAVITDNGKVIATKQLTDPETGASLIGYVQLIAQQGTVPVESTSMPVYSRLIAGPGQDKHEVDVDLPEHLFRSMNIAELHEIVQARLNELKAI